MINITIAPGMREFLFTAGKTQLRNDNGGACLYTVHKN